MIHVNSHRLLLGLVTALVFVAGIGVPVGAAEDVREGMTISPTERRYNVKPGDTITDSFQILNDGQTAYDFTVYGAPYGVTDKTYDTVYDESKPRSDAYRWAQFSKSNWHAESRETITVPFTLRISENASPGGHYGIIFAETQPAQSDSGITRKKRLGMVLYVTVSGDVKTEGEATGLTINSYQPVAPLRASASIKNAGNVDFQATSVFEVSDVFGGVKYRTAGTHTIFPSTTRDIEFTWNKSPWFGLYKVHAEVTVLGKRTVRDSFVVVAPNWLLFTALIVVLIGGINAIRRRQSKQHRSKRA